MAVWQIRSLHLSRTEARYLVRSMAYGVVWDQVYGMLRQLALPESQAFTAYTGDDTAIHGAACYLPHRIGHLYKCRPPPPSDIMQPGDRRLHWLPIALDGTSRLEASYVHCTLGGTASPNQLSSWWLPGGSETLETLYAASQEIDFDDELRKAATVSFKDTAGHDRRSLFFLCAIGKAQVLMAGCHNWKAESPGAIVCWVCMRDCAVCLATFGTTSGIDGNWIGTIAIGAIYRTITSDRPGVLLCPCHALLGNSRFCSLAGFEGTATRTVFKFNMAVQSEVGLQISDGEDANMDDPRMTGADMLSDGPSAQALLLTPVGGTSEFDHDTIKLFIEAILQRMTQAQEGPKKMQECDYSQGDAS